MMGGGGAAWSGAGREDEGTGEEEILRQTHHLAGDGRENLCLPKQDYLTLAKRETKLFLLSLVSLPDPETPHWCKSYLNITRVCQDLEFSPWSGIPPSMALGFT